MKKLLFLLLFFPLQLFAQYNWLPLTNAPKSYRCDDVYFLTPQIGWVIHAAYNYGVYSSYPVLQYGQVWHTRNGGNTWALMHDSASTFYRCVGFTDSLNGWVGNLADSTATPDTIPFYQTHDGGKTLIPVTLPNPKPKGICGISVVTDSVIYAYGRYFGPPRLAKTTNGGKTWTTQDLSSYASVGLIDGWFWNKDTGFITGQDGANAVILHTNDGGVTWQTVYHASRNDSDHVWKLSFPSRDTGYGSLECLKTTQPKRYFVKTIDGGQTWTEYPFISNYDEEGCGFINDSVGWIGGDPANPNYVTFDGGNTWAIDKGFGIAKPPYACCNTSYKVNRFRKFGDTLMYASGYTVYKLNGKTTGINELNTIKMQVYNYPNPYSDQTIITYNLNQTCLHVSMEIFNSSGQIVYYETLGSNAVGKHQFIFNKKIPAGVYYYTIITDEFLVTKKMVHIN